METKYLIFGLIGIFLLINSMRPPVSASSELIRCQDYTYRVNLNVDLVEVNFYQIIDDKEIFFKTVPITDRTLSTLLHCNNQYKIIYKSEGYKDYEEVINIGDSMPSSISEIKNINLIGGTN